jgi:hypothetical protein
MSRLILCRFEIKVEGYLKALFIFYESFCSCLVSELPRVSQQVCGILAQLANLEEVFR